MFCFGLYRTVAIAASCFAFALATAEVRTWTGESTNSRNWRVPENWGGGSFPVSGDSLVFAGVTRTNPNNNNQAGLLISNITFDVTSGSFVLGGSSVVLSGEICNNSYILQTVGIGLFFTNDCHLNTADGALRVTGGISGAGALIKTGQNTLFLEGTNSCTGDTLVNEGIVALSSPDSIAQTGSLYLTGGTLLELNFSGRTASVDRLYFDGMEQAKGMWGAVGSGAENESDFFSGSGVLTVRNGMTRISGFQFVMTAKPRENGGKPKYDPEGNLIPDLNFSPEEHYPPEVRNYQGVPSLEYASNGRLWATWYCGPIGEDIYNYVFTATSSDNGETWSQPVFMIDPDGPGPLRACNPVFWKDPTGKLWLFWSQFPNSKAGNSKVYTTTTQNPGAASPDWTEPRVICDGVTQNRPLVLSSGTWLLPVARWYGEESAIVVASTDQGETWHRIGAATVPDPDYRSCDEPMIIERNDGTLLMFLRTQYGIGKSISTNSGVCWTPVEETGLPHTPARFHLSRLLSGNLLLIKHGPLTGSPVGRKMLTAYVSEDDGESWLGGLMLDERYVSYPDAAQSPDGTIYSINDRERKTEREILMNRFTEGDIFARELISTQGRLSVLINHPASLE